MVELNSISQTNLHQRSPQMLIMLHSSMGHPDKSLFERKVDDATVIWFLRDIVTSFPVH